MTWRTLSISPYHLDLSYAAFDQIAERHRGVVDLKAGLWSPGQTSQNQCGHRTKECQFLPQYGHLAK